MLLKRDTDGFEVNSTLPWAGGAGINGHATMHNNTGHPISLCSSSIRYFNMYIPSFAEDKQSCFRVVRHHRAGDPRLRPNTGPQDTSGQASMKYEVCATAQSSVLNIGCREQKSMCFVLSRMFRPSLTADEPGTGKAKQG